jgi:hypothetical protein
MKATDSIPPASNVARQMARCTSLFLLLGLFSPLTAYSRDLFRIPVPPPPHTVLRGLFHRAAGEVKVSAARTTRDDDDDDDDDGDHRARPRYILPQEQAPAPRLSSNSPTRSKNVPKRSSEADRSQKTTASASESSRKKTPAEINRPETAETSASPPRGTDTAASNTLAPAPEGSSTSPVPPKPAANTDTKIEFARPVPGKRDMVYPPGASESEQTIVDVGGYQPGQVVRDPRTGALFRVP